jgi:hypothetical protein
MLIPLNCFLTHLYIETTVNGNVRLATSIVVAGCCSSLNSYISGCVLKGSVPSLSNLLRWGNKTDRQVLIVGRDSVAINI